MTRLEQLRARRAELVTELRTILDTAKAENRELNADEETTWKARSADESRVKDAIEREERVASAEAELATTTRRTPPPVESPDPGAGRAPAVHTREDRPYSLLALFRALKTQDWRDARVERRMADALRERHGREPEGVFVPYAALLPMQRQAEIEKRDVDSSGAPSLIATDLVPQEFIELLRNEAKVVMAGARVIPNLVGTIDIGRQNAAAVGGWLATETATIVEGQLTTDKITLSPKTFALRQEITRKMLKQSTPGVEELVRDDLRQVIGLAIDAAAINGSGASGQPTGVLTASGTGTVTHSAGVVTWANVVEYEADLGAANALRGRLAWMMRSSIRQILKTTAKISGAGATGFLMENDGSVAGYPAHVTEQMPASTLLFGNWAEVLIGMWGVLDLFADPYTLGNTGALVVRGFQDIDIGIRHAASFSKSASL